MYYINIVTNFDGDSVAGNSPEEVILKLKTLAKKKAWCRCPVCGKFYSTGKESVNCCIGKDGLSLDIRKC